MIVAHNDSKMLLGSAKTETREKTVRKSAGFVGHFALIVTLLLILVPYAGPKVCQRKPVRTRSNLSLV